MYYPSSEKKGADQLRGYREADLCLSFRLCRLLVFPWGGSYSYIHLQIKCLQVMNIILSYVAPNLLHFTDKKLSSQKLILSFKANIWSAHNLTQRVQPLFFLNPKFQVFSLLLYRLICVRSGLKPVFYRHGSFKS